MRTLYQVLIILGSALSLYVSIFIISLNIKAEETNKLLKEIRDILIKTTKMGDLPTNKPKVDSEEKETDDGKYYPPV